MKNIKLHHFFIGVGFLVWISLGYIRIMINDTSIQMEIKLATISIEAILFICTGFIIRGKDKL
jgi:hypothetical protein